MKKEFRLAIVFFIGFISLLWCEKPLREFLIHSQWDELIAKQFSSITVRVILIVLLFKIIKKLQLVNFTGLNSWKRIDNKQSIILATSFIIMGITSNWTTYSTTKPGLLTLFMLSTFAVGIFEELLFRGTIFPLVLRALDNVKRPVIISAILSSLMFGLVHFVNLFSQPENFAGILSQVFFATSIGVFFCGLMIRTRNILVPCVIHALVNFSFGAGQLKHDIEQATPTEDFIGIDWSSLIPTTIFFTIIFLGGIFMIVQSDREIFLKL